MREPGSSKGKGKEKEQEQDNQQSTVDTTSRKYQTLLSAANKLKEEVVIDEQYIDPRGSQYLNDENQHKRPELYVNVGGELVVRDNQNEESSGSHLAWKVLRGMIEQHASLEEYKQAFEKANLNAEVIDHLQKKLPDTKPRETWYPDPEKTAAAEAEAEALYNREMQAIQRINLAITLLLKEKALKKGVEARENRAHLQQVVQSNMSPRQKAKRQILLNGYAQALVAMAKKNNFETQDEKNAGRDLLLEMALRGTPETNALAFAMADLDEKTLGKLRTLMSDLSQKEIFKAYSSAFKALDTAMSEGCEYSDTSEEELLSSMEPDVLAVYSEVQQMVNSPVIKEAEALLQTLQIEKITGI